MKKKHKILIVDDEKELLNLFKNELGELFFVITSPSVRMAIKTLETVNVDLVVWDYLLADGNGIEVRDYLKVNRKDIPSICITGSDVLDHKLGCKVFRKPINMPKHINSIKNLLQHK